MDAFSVAGEVAVCVDQDVVHVYRHPILPGVLLERFRSSLSGRLLANLWSSEEGHDPWFEQALVDDECCFPLVSLFDSNIVVAPSHVEFREQCCAFDPVDELQDKGEWGNDFLWSIRLSYGNPERGGSFPSFLLMKKNGGGIWTFRGADVSFLQVFLDEDSCNAFCSDWVREYIFPGSVLGASFFSSIA